MYQFFVEPEQVDRNDIMITGPDVNHIKNVLRMQVGDEVNVVVNGDDREYRCKLEAFSDKWVMLKLMFVKQSNVELPCKVYLFQGLPKSDKMELIIQKTVELGVYELIPVATDRSVVKLDKNKEAARVRRWNAISEAAAKQSKRAIIPKVRGLMDFNEAMEYCQGMDVRLIPYELSDMDDFSHTRKIIGNIKKDQKVAIFIGPEGGFSEDEIGLANGCGLIPITLGHRILRTETAGMVVMSWLVYDLEQ